MSSGADRRRAGAARADGADVEAALQAGTDPVTCAAPACAGVPRIAAAEAADAASPRVAEAIDVLRHKPVQSTTLERVRRLREADALVAGLPQPLQLGRGLAHVLETISVPVAPCDLLIGRIVDEVPDAAGEAFFQESLQLWGGGSRPRWMHDGGHETFAWDRLLELGLAGLQADAQAARQRHATAGAPAAVLDWLTGATLVAGAFRTWAHRCGAAADAAGLGDAAARCVHLADGPPRTFAEALQLLWLVGLPYCTMIAANPTLTFGRVDELLWPFYRRDRAEGGLTSVEAGGLIEDFYVKNNLILGRGEHQMSGGADTDTGWARNLTYDAPQYIVVGGRRADGSASATELTDLFLERIVPRFENPLVVVRYSADMPDATWRQVCAKMRANASMMVYSDERVIPALEGIGLDAETAKGYTMHGCNWPDIPRGRTLGTHFVQLPVLLREALLDAAPQCDLGEILADVRRRLRAELDVFYAQTRRHRATWEAGAPGGLRVDDLFLDGPVERGRSWALGGTQHSSVVVSIAGLATAADGLGVIAEATVHGPDATAGAPAGRRLGLVELQQAVREDFDGDERLRQLCVNRPRFGQDDRSVDDLAVRLLDAVLDEIDAACGMGSQNEVLTLRCLETDMRHRPFGAATGATPDGRHAGEPISENTSPTPGAARHGFTAMLTSMARLPFHRVHSGALNLRLQPELFAGEAGLDRLAQLLRVYFDMGGLQAQLSLVDVAQLRDAQAHPERHRDLMVRITGYSAAFVDMTRAAQEEIIRREELGA